MKINFIIGVLLLTVLFHAGCGTARRGALYSKPVETDSPQLVEGQRHFMKHCNQCHPGGAAGLGPAINNKPLPGFLMKFQVRRGLGAMPAFSEEHISDKELDDLIAYLKTLRRAG
jgi:mono/diheme cytochrome c family protein